MNFLKTWLFRLLLLAAFLLALLAASYNSQAVPLSFLGFETPSWPISWWMLLAFVAGVGAGVGLNFVSNTRLRIDARRARNEAARSNQALDRARHDPDTGA